jgi:hypothetical protein
MMRKQATTRAWLLVIKYHMLAIKLQFKKIKRDLYFVKDCFQNIHTMLEFLVFAYVMLAFSGNADTPPNFSKDPKVGPKTK